MILGRQIDVLTLLASTSRERKMSLQDPNTVEIFLAEMKNNVTAALSNEALLHGQRTQNMFEALLVSLGEYKILAIEDAGRVHPNGLFIAPDFRLVLNDGRQWLVEVKNVYNQNSNPFDQRLKLRETDVQKMENYANNMGVPLKFAIYWAIWGSWTLVDASDLEKIRNKRLIKMKDALIRSEIAEIGDRIIGAEPPLKLHLLADQTKRCSIDNDGHAEFTVGEAKMFCSDREILDRTECDLAWTFMNYGKWSCSEPNAIVFNGELKGIEFVWNPRERPNAGQKFEIIGHVSSIFSRYYAESTLGSNGLIQTEADLVPGWFRPLLDQDRKSDALPLWIFHVRPGLVDP